MTTAQLDSLRAELKNDPLGMGYTTLLSLLDDSTPAGMLNALTGKGVGVVKDQVVNTGRFQLQVASAFFRLPTIDPSLRYGWEQLLAMTRSWPEVPLEDPAVKGLLAKAVVDGILTRPEVDAVGKRKGSRAEVLFGPGVIVQADDVSECFRAKRGG